MKYQSWLEDVPVEIKEDAIWTLKVYRVALYMSDLSWLDIKPILDRKLFKLSDQLYSSVGSISSNIAEGYSRSSGKEQARFYEIALGSTREAKDWYFKSRHILGRKVAYHRIKILTKIAKLLLTMINERRDTYKVEDTFVEYSVDLVSLLHEVPLSQNSD